MIARFLSIAGPLWCYASLGVLFYGLWRQRQKLEWTAALLAIGALAASLLSLSPIHRLFYDEDIYISIAANLTHTPVNQITLIGGPDTVEVSSYYKEPAGWPVLLSLVFIITGRTEAVAFWIARILFALAVAAVYQLAREVVGTKLQAAIAAVIFAITPICFLFSVSAGTDVPAALFAVVGTWGLLTGNGALAAAGFALAAQTRMELLALLPMTWLTQRISSKWKVIAVALTAVEVMHVAWVMSIAPVLARVEQVPAAFSPRYLAGNIQANAKYLFNPFTFSALIAVAAIFSIIRAWRGSQSQLRLMSVHVAALLVVYLFFYAGSFEINPRYAIQLLAPMSILAAAMTKGRWAILTMSIILPYTRPYETSPLMQALIADHNICVDFASKLDARDMVISGDPEIFLNHNARIINAVFASQEKRNLDAKIRSARKVWYHSGVRANAEGSPEWQADQWVKSNFELHLIESHNVSGMRTAFYELSLKLVNREARLVGALKSESNGGQLS